MLMLEIRLWSGTHGGECGFVGLSLCLLYCGLVIYGVWLICCRWMQCCHPWIIGDIKDGVQDGCHNTKSVV